jgi:ADP-heptose:LPS heptosyltransferase
VVQALPVLRLIKRGRPSLQVYWWLNDALAPLLDGDPDLAGLYLFARRGWGTPGRWRELFRQIRELRRMQFDWVIDLQGLARSGMMAWLANGGVTVGLDDSREGARGLYDVVVSRPSYYTHAVDWYRAVLPVMGLSAEGEYVWMRSWPGVAAGLRERWGAGERWVGLQPGARWLNKRWPVESFGKLVELLRRNRPGLRFVIMGGGEDRELGRALAELSPGSVLDMTGRTTLPEMVEWLRRCEVLVTNDTGPMHVAAALGRPVVALFGPTEPRRTGPYGQPGGVVRRTDLGCMPCLSDRCRHVVPVDCLRGLGVEDVAARVEGWLRRGAGGTAGAGGSK